MIAVTALQTETGRKDPPHGVRVAETPGWHLLRRLGRNGRWCLLRVVAGGGRSRRGRSGGCASSRRVRKRVSEDFSPEHPHGRQRMRRCAFAIRTAENSSPRLALGLHSLVTRSGRRRRGRGTLSCRGRVRRRFAKDLVKEAGGPFRRERQPGRRARTGSDRRPRRASDESDGAGTVCRRDSKRNVVLACDEGREPEGLPNRMREGTSFRLASGRSDRSRRVEHVEESGGLRAVRRRRRRSCILDSDQRR